MILLRSTTIVEHICPFDDALDTKHPDYSYEEYLKTGDRKHLPLREGAVPAVFKLRPLTRAQFMSMMRLEDAERPGEAIAYGLVSVSGLRREGDDHDILVKHTRTSLGERLDKDSLNELFAPEVFGDVGMRIFALSSTINPT